MFDAFLGGLILGWGVAIPIGAINLEMIRRNLQFGTYAGFGLGLGACLADVTYLTLLSIGVLNFLNHPVVLKIVGIGGSFLLAWFAYKALRMKANYISEVASPNAPQRSFLRHTSEGYLLTLINPTTILFWSSITLTIAHMTHGEANSILYAAMGVLVGTFSWVSGLNIFLHTTRHKLSKRTIQKINILGGIILLGFAVLGFWRAM